MQCLEIGMRFIERILVVAAVLLCATTARAEVTRFDVTSRAPVPGYAYERVAGRITVAPQDMTSYGGSGRSQIASSSRVRAMSDVSSMGRLPRSSTARAYRFSVEAMRRRGP